MKAGIFLALACSFRVDAATDQSLESHSIRRAHQFIQEVRHNTVSQLQRIFRFNRLAKRLAWVSDSALGNRWRPEWNAALSGADRSVVISSPTKPMLTWIDGNIDSAGHASFSRRLMDLSGNPLENERFSEIKVTQVVNPTYGASLGPNPQPQGERRRAVIELEPPDPLLVNPTPFDYLAIDSVRRGVWWNRSEDASAPIARALRISIGRDRYQQKHYLSIVLDSFSWPILSLKRDWLWCEITLMSGNRAHSDDDFRKVTRERNLSNARRVIGLRIKDISDERAAASNNQCHCDATLLWPHNKPGIMALENALDSLLPAE